MNVGGYQIIDCSKAHPVIDDDNFELLPSTIIDKDMKSKIFCGKPLLISGLKIYNPNGTVYGVIHNQFSYIYSYSADDVELSVESSNLAEFGVDRMVMRFGDKGQVEVSFI